MKICIFCKKPFRPIHVMGMTQKTCSIKCKILKDVKKKRNGCWIYKNSSSGVYGKIRWDGKWYSSHRESYKAFNGEIEDGKWVCHKCDTPKCVNPEHLFLGTAKDNMRDAKQKKRLASGERNHFSKFTDNQVREIRLLKNEGFTLDRLSRIFNCSFVYLVKILKKELRIGD